jgi:PAS domain S-box-containing protein
MAKAKILIVEDEAITAKDLQNRLRGLGYDAPAIAASREGAIKRVEEIEPDLVVMDIILKGDMDGIEAAEQIHDRFDIPVVYVTAYLDEARLEKTKVTEPYGYITKPFEDKELRPVIEMALQRHKREKALRTAEQDWRNSFNSLEDIMLIIDRDYTIENINEIGLKLVGKSKEEVIGQKCYQVIHGAENPAEFCPFKETLETKQVESTDRYEERFGKYYSIKSSPIFDENGEIIKFVDLMRDITERKRVEKELRATEEKYKTIFETVPISLVLFDKDGLILDINTWHLTNIARGKATKADLIGKNIITHPSIVNAGLSETYKRVLEGEPFDKKGVYFPTLIPGTSGYFDVKGVPVFKDGEVIGAVALHDDITERKQMEEKQRLFSHAVDSSIDGLAMGDLEGRITYVNDAFVRMFGYSREELIGNEIAFIYSEDQLPKLEKALKATMAGGWIGELVGKRKNGELFPMAISSSLIKDDEGNLIAHMASHEDISERKRAEEELKKKNEDLELFNRLAVGRELKMIELKKEINALLLQLGEASKYEIAGEEDKKNYEL